MFQYRKSNGDISDEIAAETLIALVRSGEIKEETSVRHPPGGDWQPAWRLEVLQSAFGLSVASSAPEPSAAKPVAEARPAPLAQAPSFDAGLSIKTRKNPQVLALILALFVLLIAVMGFRARFGGFNLLTRDGAMHLKLTSGWQVRTPDPDLEAQADTDGGDTVVLVGKVEILPEEKVMSLETMDFSLMQGTIHASRGFQDYGVRTYRANDLEYLRHDFRGNFVGRDGVFTLVTTRTPKAYYRLIVGTTPQLASRRKKDVDAIVMSFKSASPE